MYYLQEDFFRSFDQTNIFYCMALPQTTVKGVVILIHGWSEHSKHHSAVMEALVEHGFAVYGIDLRGHGRSMGQKGYISEWDDYLRDVYCLIGIVQKLHKKMKLFILAHSMGCTVSIRFVQTYQEEFSLAGLILSAPMLKLAVEVPEIKAKLSRFMSKWFPRFSLKNPLHHELLTRDPEKITEIKTDPLFHFTANARWYTEALTAMDLCVEGAHLIRVPTLIMHGLNDGVNSIEGSEIFFNNLSVKDKRFDKLKDTLHNLFDEINRHETYDRLTQWIQKHC